MTQPGVPSEGAGIAILKDELLDSRNPVIRKSPLGIGHCDGTTPFWSLLIRTDFFVNAHKTAQCHSLQPFPALQSCSPPKISLTKGWTLSG